MLSGQDLSSLHIQTVGSKSGTVTSRLSARKEDHCINQNLRIQLSKVDREIQDSKKALKNPEDMPQKLSSFRAKAYMAIPGVTSFSELPGIKAKQSSRDEELTRSQKMLQTMVGNQEQVNHVLPKIRFKMDGSTGFYSARASHGDGNMLMNIKEKALSPNFEETRNIFS